MKLEAAETMNELREAGASTADIHAWFSHPRRELGGLSPSDALQLGDQLDGPGSTLVLDLALADIAAGVFDEAAAS